MESSPRPCQLVLIMPHYLPLYPIIEYPQPMFLPQCERPSLTRIQNNRKYYRSVYIYIFGQQTGKQTILHIIVARILRLQSALNFLMNRNFLFVRIVPKQIMASLRTNAYLCCSSGSLFVVTNRASQCTHTQRTSQSVSPRLSSSLVLLTSPRADTCSLCNKCFIYFSVALYYCKITCLNRNPDLRTYSV